MNTTTTSIPTPSTSNLDLADATNLPASLTAFEKRAAEIAAVRDEELVPINVSVLGALTTVFGVLPNLAPYRARIAALPEIDHAKVEALEEYANALAWAHELWRAASEPDAVVPGLAATVTQLRDRFATDVSALAARGLVSVERAAALHSGVGHRAVVDDLLGLCGMLRDRWDAIRGKTAVEAVEVHQAEVLAHRLLVALGERELAPAVKAEVAMARQRAFTLFVRAYDETRRAIAFVRWADGDANAIAPSLWTGRGNGNHGRKKAENEPESDVAQANAETKANAASATTSPAPSAATPASPSKPVPQGLPGASPFVTA